MGTFEDRFGGWFGEFETNVLEDKLRTYLYQYGPDGYERLEALIKIIRREDPISQEEIDLAVDTLKFHKLRQYILQELSQIPEYNGENPNTGSRTPD